MHMNMKKWRVLPLDKNHAVRISQEENLPFFLAMMLEIRGFKNSEQISEFLSDDGVLSDPFLMVDMDKAVSRILRAIDDFEKIAVYGDYDADGVTATAMLYSYLLANGADVLFYIPDREEEGYGMNLSAIDYLHEQNVKLIITVDNGIASKQETQYAKSLGIDMVITDHHRVQEGLPDACAVVDPCREDCTSAYPFFSGVGVAFKLIMALEGEDGVSSLLENYADLVAIGTIGDIVPLTGENRLLVKKGLACIANTDRPGLAALIEKAGVSEKMLASGNIAFSVVPRINAVGRLGSPQRAVQLLICDDPDEAAELAQDVCQDNDNRKMIENEVYEKAMELLQKDTQRLYDRVLVLEGENWHHGVIGIVASRITERFGKPSIILSCSDGKAKGSGRSVEGFSLFDAIASCSDLLIKYGGHTMAAGLNLKTENIEMFRRKINAYAQMQGEMPVQKITIDCKLKPASLSLDMPLQLKSLAPFGMDNVAPLFGLYDMQLQEVYPIGNGKHLRLSFSRDNVLVRCIKFGMSKENFPYVVGDKLDLAVTLEAQVFRGEETLSVFIKDMRPSKIDEEKIIQEWHLYEAFRRKEAMTKEEVEKITPDRTVFSTLYRFLKAENGWKWDALSLFSRSQMTSIGKMLVALDILMDRGLISLATDSITYHIKVLPSAGKIDLQTSPIFTTLQELTRKER